LGRNRRNRPSLRWGISRNEAEQAGYRSTYECAIGRQLTEAGIVFEYEARAYPVHVDASRSYVCKGCEQGVVRRINYTPDFFLNDGTFIVEAKGRLDAQARAKAKAFKEQYPYLEYALLFEENNKISRVSKTRYTDWADKYGILSAVGLFPLEWLKEVK
jgi:hypothetical protein